VQPGLAAIKDAIGPDFLDDAQKLTDLNAFADDAQFGERIAEVKRANKVALAGHLKQLMGIRLDPDALFDVQIKRIHEYKRQLLNLVETVALYDQIRSHPERDWTPRVKIFGGKAAPSYHNAKLIIKLANDIARRVNSDPSVGGLLKVVFVPNYNVTLAERIIPAADLSEQISTAGMEASGTGNMKFALNGALTIGTLDGANIEIKEHVGDDNIFIFGLTADEVAEQRANGYNPRAMIEGSRELQQAIRPSPAACSRPTIPTAMRASWAASTTATGSCSPPISTPITPPSARWMPALGRPAGMAGERHPQHRQCRLVLVGPHHRRICPRHLGRFVNPPRRPLSPARRAPCDPLSLCWGCIRGRRAPLPSDPARRGTGAGLRLSGRWAN
jgi:glucan phosphorylase